MPCPYEKFDGGFEITDQTPHFEWHLSHQGSRSEWGGFSASGVVFFSVVVFVGKGVCDENVCNCLRFVLGVAG